MDLDGNTTINSGENIQAVYNGTTTLGFWDGISVANFNRWCTPQRVSVEEVGDTIEMIFIETSNMTLAVYPARPPARQVFKIIYSCKDGKWNKSERIYGEIIPAQDEQYEFE